MTLKLSSTDYARLSQDFCISDVNKTVAAPHPSASSRLDAEEEKGDHDLVDERLAKLCADSEDEETRDRHPKRTTPSTARGTTTYKGSHAGPQYASADAAMTGLFGSGESSPTKRQRLPPPSKSPSSRTAWSFFRDEAVPNEIKNAKLNPSQVQPSGVGG